MGRLKNSHTLFSNMHPVNLQFPQANLMKNSLAIVLSHLCGIAFMKKQGMLQKLQHPLD